MISQEMAILMITAASLGFFHTLFGPDHYLPFIVLARARKWSWLKTSWITALCGFGHIASSVVLGLTGIAFGLALTRLEIWESFSGNLAAWLLITFGLVYFVFGLRAALRNKPHRHLHAHLDGNTHTHEHKHTQEHLHVHEKKDTANITPWVLFIIFVLGPCEPLIPILMYPAAKSSLAGLILVTAIFGSVTIITMLSIVLISTLGINLISLKSVERYTHAMAGGIIFLCGMSIQFLGL